MTATTTTTTPRGTGLGRALRTFRKSPAGVAGLVFILLLVVVAVAAPLLAPHDPNHQSLSETIQSPSGDHWLGTDSLGRDVLSRLIYGTRISLLAGLETVAVAFGLGVPMGLVAGYKGGWIDRVLSVLSDSFMSVPALVLALAVISALGPGIVTAMFAVGLVLMPRFFRLARATTKDLVNEPFVRASTSIGCKPSRVLFAHILPNALPPLIVQVSIVLGTAILAEASLSFLGLGVRAPTASWGSMLSDAADWFEATHLPWGPGIALTLTILAFALVGDGIRDALGVGRAGGGAR